MQNKEIRRVRQVAEDQKNRQNREIKGKTKNQEKQMDKNNRTGRIKDK
jgi:hypothetical protein